MPATVEPNAARQISPEKAVWSHLRFLTSKIRRNPANESRILTADSTYPDCMNLYAKAYIILRVKGSKVVDETSRFQLWSLFRDSPNSCLRQESIRRSMQIKLDISLQTSFCTHQVPMMNVLRSMPVECERKCSTLGGKREKNLQSCHIFELT